MAKGLYYLAVPYQGSDEEKSYRTQLSLDLTTQFLHHKVHLFAPILYVNKIAENLGFSCLEDRRKVIMPYLLDFLKVSKAMILVTAQGWRESWGIQQELLFCHDHRIPVCCMDPNEAALTAILAAPLHPDEVRRLINPDFLEGER